MRRIVYISDRKLATFVDERRSMFDFSADAEVSLLNAIKLKFASSKVRTDGPPDIRESLKRVDEVVSFLEGMNEPPQWYESEQLEVGSWLQFDTKMAYGSDKLAFFMWNSAERRGVSRAKRIPDVVLLLHGSIDHALEYRKSADRIREKLREQADQRMSTAFGFLQSTLSTFSRIEQERKIYGDSSTEEHVADLLDKLYGQYLADGQGNMTGYARVTAVERAVRVRPDDQDRVVLLASPLYVEEV